MKFNEDTRVKIPATIQFMRLGYKYQSIKNQDIDGKTNIFTDIFKKSLERLNDREFNDDEVLKTIDEIYKVIKRTDLGEGFYHWIKRPHEENRYKIIDFDNIENNDFRVCNELEFLVEGRDDSKGAFRPDITILINGIPLSFLEVKSPNNSGGIQEEFRRMIDKRLLEESHEKFFNMFQIVSFSNNMNYEAIDDAQPAEEVKAGSFYTTPNKAKTFFSFFREEEDMKNYNYIDISEEDIKKVLMDNKYSPSEYEKAEFQTNLRLDSPCNSFITSLYDKERLLFMLRYGIMYVEGEVKERHIMRYPQFFASRRIIKMLENDKKSGIIWHTQGSGKTALAAYANLITRDYYAKKGINTRFFFVVDRLDLLTQSADEFTKRGFSVDSVQNKASFAKELSKSTPEYKNMDAIGQFCCVNIQKFSENMPIAEDPYGTKTQRVFFIDEAHRSYKRVGEYFKNLMMSDPNGIFIALTGTPLLSKKERSNLKFGDYIHKYFYDKSIADGYTLRIKRENIDTSARTEIRRNLELEDPEIDSKLVLESDSYIDSLCRYIEEDFYNFRITNNDDGIGAMVVCMSNKQAKKIHKWFQDNSIKFATGLVITDGENLQQKEDNKENQRSFKYDGYPDILVVHQMLTVGYDVNRLKKMYLLRNAKDHTLLQTISRVNRPYRSKSGKYFQYGYITDFVDISEEYDRTIAEYLKELEEEMSDAEPEEGGLGGLVIGVEDIWKKYLAYKEEFLKLTKNTENLEEFTRIISDPEFKKDDLYKLRRLIKAIMACHTEFLVSRAFDKAKDIDVNKLNLMQREVQKRIDFLNIKDKPMDMLSVLDNKEIVNILYDFKKTNVHIADFSELTDRFGEKAAKNIQDSFDDIIGTIGKIHKEVNMTKNLYQIELISLDEFLKKLFAMLDITNIEDLSNYEDLKAEFEKAYDEIKKVNEFNRKLSERFDGEFSFVAAYQGIIKDIELENQKNNIDTPIDEEYKNDLLEMMSVIYEKYKKILENDRYFINNRKNFITGLKQKVVVELVKSGLYSKLNLSGNIDNILTDLYRNILKYRF